MKKVTHSKMKKSIKNKWVKALRSGDYIQGDAQLCNPPEDEETDDYTFCCLGVLENLYCLANNESFTQWGDAVHSERCADWSGLPITIDSTGDPYKDEENPTIEKLTTMNDGTSLSMFSTDVLPVKPKSFKQIANWIEKNL